MTESQANAVYDVLMKHAGLNEHLREDFVRYQTVGTGQEFRFIGSLGFGGKFYAEPYQWRVGCYREDETPARLEMIKETNEALKELHQKYIQGENK